MKDTNDTTQDERRIIEALEAMKEDAGESYSPANVNLAELERRTGVTRAKLRRLKENSFEFKPHGSKGRKAETTVLTGYTETLDGMLRDGITNSSVCMDHIRGLGYTGGQTAVKEYISAHRHLVPAKRQIAVPQGNRGRRYTTGPGEAFQMDWGFTNVLAYTGEEFRAACFSMICHHCGERYIEFFPNAKQENLFIGMLHAFHCMGVPEYVLTDNMKSVVLRRDIEGKPVWQGDYEAFMRTVGFKTKLCKPRHPFTKGKVERLVRFVKENFLVGRTFFDVTDLNRQALYWCEKENNIFHKATFGVPHDIHVSACAEKLSLLENSVELRFYLCPPRKISFDGFVNYEGRRFGVPYTYAGSVVRVMRKDDTLYIYSADLSQLIVTHEVTWSKRDSYCKDQYIPCQPEELPSMPIKTQIRMLKGPDSAVSFEKFNFDKEADWDE